MARVKLDSEEKKGVRDETIPAANEVKVYTRAEVQEVLDEIAKRFVASGSAYMHSMLLLNHILRLPNASEIFDDGLKDQAKDLWLKVKSTGLQLTDPPLLFGMPPKVDGDARA